MLDMKWDTQRCPYVAECQDDGCNGIIRYSPPQESVISPNGFYHCLRSALPTNVGTDAISCPVTVVMNGVVNDICSRGPNAQHVLVEMLKKIKFGAAVPCS